jgi:hypothetical protein
MRRALVLALVLALAAGGAVAQGVPPASATGCGVTQSCAAVSYEAEASSGTGFACTAALESCQDLGPGLCNFIGTDASGRIRLGSSTCGPEVWVGEGSTRFAQGQVITGYYSMEGGSTGIRNLTTGVIPLEGTSRHVPEALGTCNAAKEFGLKGDSASGVSTGARSRVCLCTSDGAGTPAYEWRNIGCPNTSGTATTCPVCP